MHGSRYNVLGCKKKLDMRMNIACSNSQQRLMPPFTSDLQIPLSNKIHVEFNIKGVSKIRIHRKCIHLFEPEIMAFVN